MGSCGVYFFVRSRFDMFRWSSTHWICSCLLLINITTSILFFYFFFTSKGHSITQTWGGLGRQTGIEQSIKCNSLWKDLAVLAKKSEIWLRVRGTWMMLKSGKHICSVSIFSNYVAKLGYVWGSFIIAIRSLQCVPKLQNKYGYKLNFAMSYNLHMNQNLY